jgi:hypothetical protein
MQPRLKVYQVEGLKILGLDDFMTFGLYDKKESINRNAPALYLCPFDGASRRNRHWLFRRLQEGAGGFESSQMTSTG